MAPAPHLAPERDVGQTGLLGDLADRGRANVLAILDATAGRRPKRTGVRRLRTEQQQPVLLIEPQDPDGVAKNGRGC